MKFPWLFLVFVAAPLCGCYAPMIWDKPGATQAEYNLDAYNCERDARASVLSFGGGLAGANDAREFFKRCMIAHGYTLRQA